MIGAQSVPAPRTKALKSTAPLADNSIHDRTGQSVPSRWSDAYQVRWS